jgi:L-alanine-DL-glutamate epimerase-like enolase superfamily enzyme
VPLRKLREAFADTIEIMLEFHSNWSLPSALRIAKAVEPYRPMWLEDVLLTGSLKDYRELAAATATPILLSERMAGPFEFEALLESGVARYVSFDLTWCGGLSLARKVAAAAEAHQLLVVPHTAGGPLLFYASTHLTTAATNVGIQESCQRFFERDWPAMLEDPIVPANGTVAAPDLPGFGMRVKPEVWATRRRSSAQHGLIASRPRSIGSTTVRRSNDKGQGLCRQFVREGRANTLSDSPH